VEEKNICIPSKVLFVVGILLLLASAFDLLPAHDNLLVFLGIACFIVGGVIKKTSKGSCCK
jgi:hypothetical protein